VFDARRQPVYKGAERALKKNLFLLFDLLTRLGDLSVHGFGDDWDFGVQPLQGVENGVEQREEGVGEHPEFHPLAHPAHHDEDGHVLHDQASEHAANIEQNRLHGAIPNEVRHLFIAHDRQEQRKERQEWNELIAVKNLHRRGEDKHHVLQQRQHLIRSVRERDGPHEWNDERNDG